MNGLKIKSNYTIVEPWLYRVGIRATQIQFDVLVAGSAAGVERYMEVEKLLLHPLRLVSGKLNVSAEQRHWN